MGGGREGGERHELTVKVFYLKIRPDFGFSFFPLETEHGQVKYIHAIYFVSRT